MRSLEESESQRQSRSVVVRDWEDEELLVNGDSVSILQDESCIDWLHNSVDALSILTAHLKWLRWCILHPVYFTIIFKKLHKLSPHSN